jgi:hypothetical protein
MELLWYAPHLNTKKLKVNKFFYGLNFNIRERVRILMPQTLHEAVQKDIIAEEEINSSGQNRPLRPTRSVAPRTTPQQSVNRPTTMHRDTPRGPFFAMPRHPTINQRPPYRPPTQQQYRPVQQNRSTPQNNRPVNPQYGSRSQGPKRGCWTCKEPHYQRDCPHEKKGASRAQIHMTVGDLGKAHRIHAAVNNHQEEHQSTVLETTGKINNQKFSILIDPRATDSFISHAAFKILKVKVIEQKEFSQVEMASREKQRVGGLVKDCEIDLGECIAKVPLYITILGSYDIVIGMDWLETHEAILDCKNKKLSFVDDLGQNKILKGVEGLYKTRPAEKGGVEQRPVSTH